MGTIQAARGLDDPNFKALLSLQIVLDQDYGP
jgi:hypothetical protein